MDVTEIPLVILGVPFHAVNNRQTLDWCLEHVQKKSPGYVTTPNLDFLMQAGKDPELYRILIQSDLVIADGMPIVWLSRCLGPRLPERVAGSDLVLSLSQGAAEREYTVFHLGGKEGVPEKAGEVLAEKFEGFRLAGAYSPPKADLLEMNHDEILEKISSANPDILYVAFGAPKQEKWINLHFRDWQVPLALGIGGSLDFLAGEQVRAPKWMQKTGLEWIWRLKTDPARLWKRYGSNLLFLGGAVLKLIRLRWKALRPAENLDIPQEYADQVTPYAWKPLQTYEQAKEFLQYFAGNPDRMPLLNMAGCSWLSSLELGALLTLAQRVKTTGRLPLICEVPGRITEWMEVNHLQAWFQWPRVTADWPRCIPESEYNGPRVLSPSYGTVRLIPPVELTVSTLAAWKEDVEKILDRLPPETKDVEVDAREMTFLDSAGLGYLVSLCGRIRERGIQWKLLNLSGAPLITIRLARLEKVLLQAPAAHE
jgi:N-acetylglucosaminyldiphosphoundecaprenol N-acetyl-beta-D-mannosaminyltransferase